MEEAAGTGVKEVVVGAGVEEEGADTEEGAGMIIMMMVMGERSVDPAPEGAPGLDQGPGNYF